ncbi:DUF1294 domain-containing protein [Paenibacillus septentrionalis]|uniref:DUF1294 domain-containing protein n=1 Tax=Paenibacillus septentrionalis TaxID=429342 RepID=A0ABW1UX87_9BACL
MENTLLWVVGYVLFLNIYLYWLMGKDKDAAKKNLPRIPERHFFLFSILGGATGAYLGMQAHRHKTQHRKFKIGLPIIIAVQVLLAVCIIVVLSI